MKNTKKKERNQWVSTFDLLITTKLIWNTKTEKLSGRHGKRK